MKLTRSTKNIITTHFFGLKLSNYTSERKK